MAKIYVADDRRPERKVALKVLNPELSPPLREGRR
jgi:hypothetical protein